MFKDSRRWATSLPSRARSRISARIQAFVKRIRAGCRAQQIDYVTIRTDQPLDAVLRTFLSARKQRVK
jgi:hypothetical protein